MVCDIDNDINFGVFFSTFGIASYTFNIVFRMTRSNTRSAGSNSMNAKKQLSNLHWENLPQQFGFLLLSFYAIHSIGPP